MKQFENELDKLRYMLDKAGIPYESYKVEHPTEIMISYPDYYKGNYKYMRNQIIYGAEGNGWKIDGICQLGSYGAEAGLIETYGKLGTDGEGDPLVLNAEEVFQIIARDFYGEEN